MDGLILQRDTLLILNTEIEVIATENTKYFAVFKQNSICLVPSIIEGTEVLLRACSPYYMNTDVLVKEGSVLIIEPGVEIKISEGTNLIVNGAIIAKGDLENKIVFGGLEDQEPWGGHKFTKYLRHLYF